MPDRAISVVVPVRDEAPNLLPLIAEIGAALSGFAHEIIYVDDGSTDRTAEILRGAGVRALRHAQSCGQSAAILTGVRAATGSWVATLDGDGQNDPADIPKLLLRAEAEAFDGPLLVAGHRANRRDSGVKRVTSRIANGVRARVLKDATRDTGCGLKLFRPADFLALPAFDHMHRYLPALFLRAGGRVVTVAVNHRPRRSGHSHYGTLDRLWVGMADLAGVFWLQRRWRQPEVDVLSDG